MSEANYDNLLDEPSEMDYCELHNVYYSTWLCAACRDEAADRDFDTSRDRTLEIRAQRAERRRA